MTIDRNAILSLLTPRLFLVTGLFFGIGYCYLTPPLRVPDEASHFFRAYTTTTGSCTGAPAILAPVDWRRGMDSKQIWTELPRGTTPEEMVRLMHAPRNLPYGVVAAFAVGNVYNCVPYLPGAGGIAVARLLRMSPLGMMLAGRMANLAIYLLLIYFALRLLPGWRLLMGTIALMPMALHQAGSLSADGPAIAISCLFIAYSLSLAFAEPVPLTFRQLAALAMLVVILGLCKVLVYLVPVLLLVPALRFGSTKKKWLWLGVYVALAAGAAFGWQWINRLNVERVTAIRADQGILMVENLRYALTNPVDFCVRVGRTFVGLGSEYLSEFVGKLGWLAVPLPGWLIWAYFAVLVLIAAGHEHPRLSSRARALLAALPLVNALSVFLVVWTFETPTAQIASGSGLIYGVQGRYFIPFAFPMFAAISGPWLKAGRRWLPLIAFCTVLTANSVALERVWATYYSVGSPAGTRDRFTTFDLLFRRRAIVTSQHEGKLVRRPGAAIEDQKVYVVTGGIKRWITHASWITAHGYRWPDDVIVIPAQQLQTIPTGEPIVAEK